MLSQTEMTQSHHIAASPVEIIKTRFGEISVDTGKSISFARGMLGMPDKSHFALAAFPGERMKQFTLLQSMDDHDLSFITLPLSAENSIISAVDIKSVCKDLHISESSLLLLLVVSVHRGLEGVKLSVNARAPLFIDSDRRLGVQHVFQNDAYKVQHMLS